MPTVAVVWIQRGVQAALVVGRVLGDVDRGAAVLAAEGQALEQPQDHQDGRREDADLRVGRQKADQGGRAAHDRDGQQEGVLAADDVADAAEDHRAERSDGEAGAVTAKPPAATAVGLSDGKNSGARNGVSRRTGRSRTTR